MSHVYVSDSHRHGISRFKKQTILFCTPRQTRSLRSHFARGLRELDDVGHERSRLSPQLNAEELSERCKCVTPRNPWLIVQLSQ
jgi:hypothetical protein